MLKVLNLTDEFLLSRFENIQDSVGKIWDSRTLHQHYTNHGIDHSNRIVEVIEHILQEQPLELNQKEIFILLSGIYLHDIGMQFPIIAGLDEKLNYTIDDMEEVRKVHNKTSSKIIRESDKSSIKIDLGLKDCTEYKEAIAVVAEYHTGLDLNDLGIMYIDKETIRLQLLAAILRLGDELDCDHRRVEMEYLKRRRIPFISKYHWWSHHYVENMEISDKTIRISFQFPNDLKEKEEILQTLKNKTISSINRTLVEIDEILSQNQIVINSEVEVAGISFRKNENLYKVEPELELYIKNIIINVQNKLENLTNESGINFYIDTNDFLDSIFLIEFYNQLVSWIEEENYKQALNHIKECLKYTLPELDRSLILLNGGLCSFFLGDIGQAELFLKEMHTIIQQESYRRYYYNLSQNLEASYYSNMGIIYFQRGLHDNAIFHYSTALDLHRTLKNSSGEATTLNNIGLYHKIRGDFEIAIDFLTQAKDIIKELNSLKSLATTFNNLGDTYKCSGNLKEAMEYCEIALEIFKNIQNKQGEIEASISISRIFSERKEFGKAIGLNESSIAWSQEIGYKKGIASAKWNLGVVQWKLDLINNAIELHEEALKLYEELEYKEGTAQILDNLGQLYFINKNIRNSESYFLRAANLMSFITKKSLRGIFRRLVVILDKNLNYLLLEPYIKQANELFPEDCELIGISAWYYDNKLGKSDKAEELFKQVIDLDCEDPNTLYNCGGFLLSLGERIGFQILEKASKFEKPDDLAEILPLEESFYLFAHLEDSNSVDQHLEKIKLLLLNGIRSTNLRLERNAKQAIKDNHPYSDLIEDLTKVICSELGIEVMDKYSVWKNIE